MGMLTDIAPTVALTVGVCWVLHELVEAFGGLPPSPKPADFRPAETQPSEPE
jgi:hypothetical protein